MNGIDIRRRLLISKASAPALSPVTDGLTLWIDGRDGIYDSNFQRIAQGIELQALGYYYDRVTQTYLPQYTQSTYGIASIDSGDGNIMYISRTSAAAVIYTPFSGSTPQTIVVVGTAYVRRTTSSFLSTNDYGNAFMRLTTTGNIHVNNEAIQQYTALSGISSVYAAGGGNLYINGSQSVETGTFSRTPKRAFSVGCLEGKSGKTVFKLGALYFYNRVLSASEHAQIYAYEKSIGRVL